MSINLPAELQAFVQEEIANGDYQSEEEIVRDGINLLRERRRKLDALRREIQKGIDALDRGEGIRIETEEELQAFFDDIDTRGIQRLKEAGLEPNFDEVA